MIRWHTQKLVERTLPGGGGGGGFTKVASQKGGTHSSQALKALLKVSWDVEGPQLTLRAWRSTPPSRSALVEVGCILHRGAEDIWKAASTAALAGWIVESSLPVPLCIQLWLQLGSLSLDWRCVSFLGRLDL